MYGKIFQSSFTISQEALKKKKKIKDLCLIPQNFSHLSPLFLIIHKLVHPHFA